MQRVFQTPNGTDVASIAQEMAARGMLDPTRNDKKSNWEKLIAQMAMAQKTDPGTMAGFALGKLLRQGYDTWLDNLRARESVNNTDIAKGKLRDDNPLNEQNNLPPTDFPNQGATPYALFGDRLSQFANALGSPNLNWLNNQSEERNPWEDENNWTKWLKLAVS